MIPSEARFWASARKPEEVPLARTPEVAFAGRSNVGKSSVINMLCGRRNLARTGRRPGATRGLIFYSLQDKLGFVDLPGYGYARRSATERAAWKTLVDSYLDGRQALAGVAVLVDLRRGVESEEAELVRFLGERGLPWLWVFTKSDKVPRSKRQARVREVLAGAGSGQAVVCSVPEGEGADDLWRWIEEQSGVRRRK
ncbi:MAG: ribosome biogenesis GTP-binding protein YihA/YsxC [Deltaproteobacteria bacterium]